MEIHKYTQKNIWVKKHRRIVFIFKIIWVHGVKIFAQSPYRVIVILFMFRFFLWIFFFLSVHKHQTAKLRSMQTRVLKEMREKTVALRTLLNSNNGQITIHVEAWAYARPMSIIMWAFNEAKKWIVKCSKREQRTTNQPCHWIPFYPLADHFSCCSICNSKIGRLKNGHG